MTQLHNGTPDVGESVGTLKILITDRIAHEGIELLHKQLPEAHIDERIGIKPDELKAIIGNYTALMVRSQTQVTSAILAAATQLKIVGRAGVGIDNIDTEAAARQGILVVNSPTGNIMAAAEHSIAMLLALARHIPAATASMRAGKWEKSRFVGVEVRGKVLGIIGLGKVGLTVAQLARGLGMQILAFSPSVFFDLTRKSGSKVMNLDEVLQQADFITLHTSLTNETRGLLGERELRMMKPDARLINCARGGLIDEEALLKVLNEGHLAGVALDVFSQEPIGDSETLEQIIAHERVIATPHLGASTEEAQVGVAIDVAEQIVSVLRGDFSRAEAHAPLILPE
jgi:D-3-phosphoglycerate dehydrogenase / 2-oxoglutarate reductase